MNIWAILAIILAAGMILSSIFIGADYLTGWRGPGRNSEDSWEEQLEQEWQRLLEESAALEAQIATAAPAQEDLENLAALYNQAYSYALWLEPGSAEDYLNKAAGTYRALLDLVPDRIEHRFSLCAILRVLEKEEEAREQADLVRAALEPLLQEEKATNLERYYYAALQADIYGNREEALAQLDRILETEPKDSSYYAHFAGYKEQLLAGDTDTDTDTDTAAVEEEGNQAENELLD